jgi:hypothetical protein
MTLDEIKQSVNDGIEVFWAQDNYKVTKAKTGQYMIVCTTNNDSIGLTHRDGITLNGYGDEFYTK